MGIHLQPTDPRQLKNTCVIRSRNGSDSAAADTKIENIIVWEIFHKNWGTRTDIDNLVLLGLVEN